MIPRTIDTGGDRVDTIAQTVVGFATVVPRDRDRPPDATPGVIPSCRHADLLIPIEIMTKTSVRMSVLGIGRGGITIQCDRHLLDVDRGDADEQVTDLGVCRLSAACTQVVFLPDSALFASGVHEAWMAILSALHVATQYRMVTYWSTSGGGMGD